MKAVQYNNSTEGRTEEKIFSFHKVLNYFHKSGEGALWKHTVMMRVMTMLYLTFIGGKPSDFPIENNSTGRKCSSLSSYTIQTKTKQQHRCAAGDDDDDDDDMVMKKKMMMMEEDDDGRKR